MKIQNGFYLKVVGSTAGQCRALEMKNSDPCGDKEHASEIRHAWIQATVSPYSDTMRVTFWAVV